MKLIGWDVYLNGKQIDTVFYDIDCDENYVYDGLINRDGYDSRITLRVSKYDRKKLDKYKKAQQYAKG